jgi:hypothetical protein
MHNVKEMRQGTKVLGNCPRAQVNAHNTRPGSCWQAQPKLHQQILPDKRSAHNVLERFTRFAG